MLQIFSYTSINCYCKYALTDAYVNGWLYRIRCFYGSNNHEINGNNDYFCSVLESAALLNKNVVHKCDGLNDDYCIKVT